MGLLIKIFTNPDIAFTSISKLLSKGITQDAALAYIEKWGIDKGIDINAAGAKIPTSTQIWLGLLDEEMTVSIQIKTAQDTLSNMTKAEFNRLGTLDKIVLLANSGNTKFRALLDDYIKNGPSDEFIEVANQLLSAETMGWEWATEQAISMGQTPIAPSIVGQLPWVGAGVGARVGAEAGMAATEVKGITGEPIKPSLDNPMVEVEVFISTIYYGEYQEEGWWGGKKELHHHPASPFIRPVIHSWAGEIYRMGGEVLYV